MTPEQRMWQTVIIKAVVDGLSQKNLTTTSERIARFEADAWIRAAGSDFREVCSLAGMEPEFIRDAYVNGRIDLMALNSFDKWLKARLAA